LLLSTRVLSAVQVVRNTKMMAMITPVSWLGGEEIDFRSVPMSAHIWKQLIAAAVKAGIKVIQYESLGPKNDWELVSMPSLLFINPSYANGEKIGEFLIQEKRSAQLHPNDDVHFIVEGYFFGYTLDNIRKCYLRPGSYRKQPFDQAHARALELLKNKFGITDVAELMSAPKKFASENS